MNKKKKIIISAVSVTAAAAITVSGFMLWKNREDEFENAGKVYVSPVEDINTAITLSLNGECFSGVVETQKTHEIKYDTSKKIKEILVKEGDSVKEGTELFSYDVDSMKLEKEQAELEIERMNNEISAMKNQISELESEKKNVSQDEQYSYTAQIQSLETDIAKVEYDIKVKNTEIDKIKKSINNATVKSEVSGTVGKINNVSDNSGDDAGVYPGFDQESADVIMTVAEEGNFRIKGKINEQNMALIQDGMPVIIQSRTDSSITWNGTVSEISTEPADNSQNMVYMDGAGDDMTTSSNYNFYINPETTDGLMLGQHVIILPDRGQSGAADKSGIWIYSDYIITDSDGETYVWAADKKDRLEKRYIETGESDEMSGDIQIISGLENSDCIAYPSDDYEEGMHTTTSIEDADFEENSAEDNGDVIDDGIIDDGTIDGGMIDDGIIDGGVIDDGMIDGGVIDGGIIDDGMIDDGIIDENVITDDMMPGDDAEDSGSLFDDIMPRKIEESSEIKTESSSLNSAE